jgi:hypothetical protein
MVAKKDYYKRKLNEKRMEILLQIIEEEINTAFEQMLLEDEKQGVKRFLDPQDSTFGMFLGLGKGVLDAVVRRGLEAGVKAVKMGWEIIVAAIFQILPFNDTTLKEIYRYSKNWENEALRDLDNQFREADAELNRGWETFKTDFWGIGFVASPINAIAGLAVGGKALDTAFSVLNVVSGGRAQKAYDLISGERIKGDIFEANTPQAKTKFKDLPEKEKKKVLDDLMKNPEVVTAVDAWSTTNLPKVMGSVVHDMNQAISSGQVGQVTPQEIQSYKAMAPYFVTKMFDEMKGKNKKFEVKPSPAALQAANNAVAAEIKSMPDVPAQPAQPVQQPQNPAQSVAQPQTVTTQTTRPVQQPKQ